MKDETGEPRPYVHVRRGLEALIVRPVFYELAEMATPRDTPGGPMMGVSFNGAPSTPLALPRPSRGAGLTSPQSGEGFRDWITRHLDPLDARPAAVNRSDFDLTPEHSPVEAAVLTPAAVLVGLVERPRGLSVILTRRSDALRRHAGQIALPGGRCEPGENTLGGGRARSP